MAERHLHLLDGHVVARCSADVVDSGCRTPGLPTAVVVEASACGERHRRVRRRVVVHDGHRRGWPTLGGPRVIPRDDCVGVGAVGNRQVVAGCVGCECCRACAARRAGSAAAVPQDVVAVGSDRSATRRRRRPADRHRATAGGGGRNHISRRIERAAARQGTASAARSEVGEDARCARERDEGRNQERPGLEGRTPAGRGGLRSRRRRCGWPRSERRRASRWDEVVPACADDEWALVSFKAVGDDGGLDDDRPR